MEVLAYLAGPCETMRDNYMHRIELAIEFEDLINMSHLETGYPRPRLELTFRCGSL